MPGFTSADYVHATLLRGAAALQCSKGIIGGATPGAARDTLFYGVYILKNVGPATVTIAGLADSAAPPTAQNFVISGSTTQDVFFTPPAELLNELGAFVFTPSVDAAIWVFTRAYVGP